MYMQEDARRPADSREACVLTLRGRRVSVLEDLRITSLKLVLLACSLAYS